MTPLTPANLMEEIRKGANQSGAFDNEFFKRSRIAEAPFKRDQIAKFGPEYLHVTSAFPRILLKLASRTEDLRVQALLVEILHSELGSGNPDKSHAKLFADLLQCAGVRPEEIPDRPRLPTTRALITGLNKLYARSALPVSLGAQYALEFQADNMLRQFSNAFRSAGVRDPDMVFFSIHEVEEERHIEIMTEVLIDTVNAGMEPSVIFSGAMECCTLFSNFWDGLHRDAAENKILVNK